MKNKLAKLALLLLMPLSLVGCNNKKEAPITDKNESTVIKNATSTDEYLKNKDYKSIAYAYIYNIKEGLQSYESETNGTVKAKIAFINYDIKFNSITYKNGKTFYSKDDSKSTLMTIKNEFYMVDKEKILVSKDLKKYNVYTLDDYHKISYSPDQYAIMGYVFNDESIVKTELLSDKGDNISIKYTLDNELSTHLVKVDMKNGGSLSSYPVFHTIELTLTMKRDFTPISYAVYSVYDATKPVIGTARTTQNGECLFSKVDEKITIPNETFLAEQLGAKPSEIIIDDKEQSVKDDLMTALKNLDFKHGVNINGDLKLHLDLLTEAPLALNIDTNVLFDIDRLTDDKIYQIFDLYGKFEGDNNLNTLISLVKSIAGDKLGEYADLLDNFKSLEVVYDEAGSLYLMPYNQSDTQFTMLKIRLTDVLDLVLQNVNLYNLVSGSNEDFATFTKKEGKDANNYEVEVTLNPDVNKKIEDGINKVFENPDYALIKTMLGYSKFGSVLIKIGVKDGLVNTVDASLNYYKGDGEDAPLKTLLSLHLDVTNKTFDFKTKIDFAKAQYSIYQSVQGLKARMKELTKNIYVSKGYLANADKALEEYNALTDQQKDFVGRSLEDLLRTTRNDVSKIMDLLTFLNKYDLNHLNNQAILEISKVYGANSYNTTLLKQELTDEQYNKLNNLSDYVDYSVLDGAIDRIVASDDPQAWNLTEEEIKGIKVIVDIAALDSGVSNNILYKFLLKGKLMDINSFKENINTLYNNLNN